MCDRHLEVAGQQLHGHTDAGPSDVSSSQETVYASRQEEAVAAVHPNQLFLLVVGLKGLLRPK